MSPQSLLLSLLGAGQALVERTTTYYHTDALGSVVAPPASFNRYLYVNDNPYKYVDPDGEFLNFVAKFVLDAGVNVAINYLTTGDLNVGSALKESATGILNPAKTAAGIGKLAVAASKAKRASKTAGRVGDQKRSREIANDDKASSADRGWIKREVKSIDRGQRTRIRRTPGKELAHERGREASKGGSHKHSNQQDEDLHKMQHRYDDLGRKNKERPVIGGK